MKQGAFSLVLHSHLPYCRQAGRWPHGEEWLHEASAETYLPLLAQLTDLVEAGVPIKLTLGITPVLAEQLADPLVVQHFEAYAADRVDRAEADAARFARQGDGQGELLARFYAEFYAGALRTFRDRFGRSLLGAARRLQDAGAVELLTSAATHGYLPLLSRDSSIRGQLATGVASYRRHFGRAPRAAWLPECAYRPAYRAEEPADERVRPGLETWLAEQGLHLFFAETHTIEGGQPVGKAREEVIGPYGSIPRRYVVPLSEGPPPAARTTFEPYYVGATEVAVLGRNNATGHQVWSVERGYPGDFDYREFHKKDGASGLQYWRVTGARVDLGAKDYYHPDWAAGKVRDHAGHFAQLVEGLVADYHGRTGRYGTVTAIYDTELFGHWWFEGVDWIGQVLANLAQSPVVDLSSASEFVAAHPPQDVVALPEGSWGMGGTHFTWDNADTHWMWPEIHAAELRMERLAERFRRADDATAALLNQAARELLLLQSSDWPFLVTTGQAAEYAVERFTGHLERFDLLAGLAEAGPVSPDGARLAAELYERDKLFPDLDYRLFGPPAG